jgi:hypothetical protein
MEDAVEIAPPRKRTVVAFLLLGVLIYLALFGIAEALVYRNGHANPFFKIATADRQDYDWLVLGASHAMPLDFGDTEAGIEATTGKSVINLAAQGVGPLFNRFVLEQFLERHRVRAILYVADSFAFRSRAWNEDRFTDVRLLRRAPYDPAMAGRLLTYAAAKGVDWRAPLDYLSGFSKLNDRDRLALDRWDAEASFARSYKRSSRAEDERISYLYPPGSADPGTLQRYLGELDALIAMARDNGADVVVIKPPVPPGFLAKLPGEADFDAALETRLHTQGVSFYDYSALLPEATNYFDSDHLGSRGVAAFLDQALAPLLRGDTPAGSPPAPVKP